MEGDYWAKTYGKYAKNQKKASNIEGAECLTLRALLALLDSQIPKFADDGASDLQYLLRMARSEAADMLARENRPQRKDIPSQEYPASPTQPVHVASGE